ncbi:hypothetical protein PHYBOEH_001637 [Phytophthora boehmeriae]|uniref:Uncharacterized protein n=1 Tax=Phytophthora boehmeriae TaxID=109152 RepID=A0A8T1V4T7_9STRA|nr:hypothetical protein PHYBOEH_001637 [Phytophthora boehmeriae]
MKTVDANAIFEPDKLYDLLDESVAGIAEFLLPLVFAGHVNQITWIKPSWATQIPTGVFKQLAIGKRRSTGSMGVMSELPYFVEDGLFCPEEDMEPSSVRHWDLFATELSSLAVTEGAMANARENSKAYILDVDLDYFSTWNPFRRSLEAFIGDSAVEIVKRVFSYMRYKCKTLGAMTAKECSEKKPFIELLKRLQDADARESKSVRGSEWAKVVTELVSLYPEAEQLFQEFALVLEQHREDEVARREIWDSGPFLDLPHHESSEVEIESMVDGLEHFFHAHTLDASNPPALVTIAKSTGDEFLPPKQLETVLASVLKMLERVFGKVSTQFVAYDPVEGADEVQTDTSRR